MNNNLTKSYTNYYKTINKFNILPDNLIKLYIKAYQIFKDPAMLKRIIEANQAFINTLAYKYSNNNQHYIIDLINEGNLGLIKAVKKFDVSKETTFLTYATFYIKKFILDYLYENSNSTHIPFNVINNSKKVFTFIEKYTKKFKIEPTIEKISKELSLPKSKIIDILDYKFNVYEKENLNFIDPNLLDNNEYSFIKDIKELLTIKQQNILFDMYGISTAKLTNIELELKYNKDIIVIKTYINKLLKKLKKFINI